MARRPAPYVRIDGSGRLLVKNPLTEIAQEEYRGRLIPVSFGVFHFEIALEDEISIPLAPTSFSEATEVVQCVTNQILDAVHKMALGSYPSTGTSEPSHYSSKSGLAPLPLETVGLGVVTNLTFARLFEAWAEDHQRNGGAPTTPPYWQVLIERFVAFLGHDRPQDVTPQVLRDYRDHLITNGRRLRTARHADFAAIRAIFHFGVEAGLLVSDPTVGIKFKTVRLATGRSMAGFSQEEAARILSAADREENPARRWIPWLTALTGSRVATVANLRTIDVRQVDNIWCLHISREAGPIKTAASERLVPIHSAILQRGFLQFVQNVRRERLFIEAPRRPHLRGEGEKLLYNPARTTLRRLTDWLHTLELDIGRSNGKDPNHAWRHWFKEQAFARGIPEKIADALVGHAHATTSRRYGGVSLAVMLRELEKIKPPV